jgi:hypothetical protein
MQKEYQQNADFIVGLSLFILSGFVLQRNGVAVLPSNQWLERCTGEVIKSG